MYYVELLVIGLVWGCTYALMALGLTLVYGLLRILHVAQATVFTLGAYIGLLVANRTDSLPLAFVAATLSAGLLGPLIYRLVYEPILDKPPFVALVASIGVLIGMEDGFRLIFGPYGLSFDDNPWFTATWSLGGITLNLVQIWMVAAAVVLLSAFALFAARTRAGVAWRATVSDPVIAQNFGVSVMRVRYLNFFIASALAGIGGVLVGLLNNLVEPAMGSVISYKGLAIIVLGGLGNVPGTLVASLALGVVESFGSVFLDKVLDRDAMAFLFLIVVLMVRPKGLLGGAH
ncbi:MAG: branched-chain amino acid ABC transporter permease [Burkholderiales bacterium]|nr:branched-chain amino acid ABC transporter permease [Burkholderiales bacterium]OJX04709.1 MAG: amino acid ABC transporter permease [Burkholderiales bacterium 70-64]